MAVWYTAVFTSFVAVWRLRCWLEHMGTDDTHRYSMPIWIAAVVFPHNIWVHWEHHKYPGVPYFNLLRIRELDRSVPVVPLGEILDYLDRCVPLRSGVPTRDEAGQPTIEMA